MSLMLIQLIQISMACNESYV